MIEILDFSPSEVVPERDAVYAYQGIPRGAEVSIRVEQLYASAIEILLELASPVGGLAEISVADFSRVYTGEGRNEELTPVGGMFGRADRLALFAVTIGPRPGEKIGQLFESDDFALACMLDSAASVAAENTADLVEYRFGVTLRSQGWQSPPGGVLRYSPGYCGWHISGQRSLFEYLGPQKIGLRLRESFLMDPLKSVSGVIIAGPRQIHNFPIDFEFCDECDARSCRQRLRALYADRA